MNLDAILLAVDAGPCHMRAVRSLSVPQRRAAADAAASGYLRLMPKSRRFPRRYVVTASGSHALATFDFDTLHHEVVRRPLRRAA